LGGNVPSPITLIHCTRSVRMSKNTRLQMIAMLAIGGLFGYAAATSRFDVFHKANAGPPKSTAFDKERTPVDGAACCGEGLPKGELVAMADPKPRDPAPRQQDSGKKPNILFIMGDDIGWMQPSCYHRGLMVGETPNIDRIANEGALFVDYLGMQSCTSGRNAFVTGMYPLRTGMVQPQLPGSSTYLQPGTPCIAQFLLDLGYTTGQFGKNHLGDHPDALPTPHGFEEFWGYLSHLDAMQTVTSPDIYKNPPPPGTPPPLKAEPIPGINPPAGAITPEQGIALPVP